MDDPRADAAAAKIHPIAGGEHRAPGRELAPAYAAEPAASVAALIDPACDPLFRRAVRLGTPSSWWQHVPFARWITGATAPRTFVELGTYTGVSYAAFCQAVVDECLPTRCHAVDGWRGDRHTGEYGEEIFADLRRFHDPNYAAFSTLMRLNFDEAQPWFGDGTIDLLHIDGLHTYDAVRHDFETWRPKLSERGVVLFHDINVRQGDFGVWRYWEELRGQFPSFEFHHGYGLGVIAVGEAAPAAVLDLCRLADPIEIARFRNRFTLIGEHWGQSEDLRHLANARADADRLRGEGDARVAAEAEAAALRDTIGRLETAAAERVAALRADIARLEAAQGGLAEKSAALDRAFHEIDRLGREVRRLQRSWLRRLGNLFRPG